MEPENNSMVMGSEGLAAILTSSEETNMIIRERFAKPLHKQLEISFPKSERRGSKASIRITIIRDRNMVIIISERHKVCRIMILQFKHTTICPLTAILQAASNALSAGDLNKVHNILPCIRREKVCRNRNKSSILLYLNMMDGKGNYFIFGLASIGKANGERFQGVVTRHLITILQTTKNGQNESEAQKGQGSQNQNHTNLDNQISDTVKDGKNILQHLNHLLQPA